MAGPEPRVPYNPNQEVSPDVGSPSNSLRTQASPQAFGSQIGQAVQGLGKQIENVSDPAINYVIKRQGELNTAAAVNGETEANVAYGQLFDTLKSKKGIAASVALPDLVQQAVQIHQNIRAKMPTEASAKAFDTLITRTEGFAIRDMHSYAGTQEKAWQTSVLTANKNMFVERSARPEVAFSDDAWHDNIASLKISSSLAFDDELGLSEAGLMTIDESGNASFTESKEGQQAKVLFDDYMRKQMGAAWQKRIITLADDPTEGNVSTAVQVLEANKESIPADTYASLSRSLSGPYRAMQTRTIANEVNQQVDQDWSQQNSAPPTEGGMVEAFKTQEGGPSSNVFQIQPGTWKQFAQPGEDITNPEHNQAVATRMLQKYSADYEGDLGKVATAYFSGPGNVAPKGSATPYINNFQDRNGKTVASYVDDILSRTQGQEFGGSPYYSKADYVQLNYERFLKQAQEKADQQFPGHPELAYQAVQRTDQYLKSIISSENIEDRRSLNNVYRYITDMDRKGTPLTTAYQIDNAPDPQTKADWQRVQQKFPLQTRNLVDRMAAANSRGKATNYGVNFWNNFQDVISGKTSDVLSLSQDLDSFKLTNTGMNVLKDLMDEQGTSEGKAFSNSMLDFFRKAHNQVVMNTPGVTDDVGETKFTEFMQAVLPEIQAKKKQNVPAGEMFSPDKQGFIGNTLHLYDRPLAEKVLDFERAMKGLYLKSITNQQMTTSFENITDKIQGMKALTDAVRSKQLTGTQADEIAAKKGWFVRKAVNPGVPNAGIITNGR